MLRRKEGPSRLHMKQLKLIPAQCRKRGFCFEFFIETKLYVPFKKTTVKLTQVQYSLMKIKSLLRSSSSALKNQALAINTMCGVNRQMLHVLVAAPPLMIHEPRLTSAGVSRQGNLSHGASRGGGLTSVPLNEFSCRIIF